MWFEQLVCQLHSFFVGIPQECKFGFVVHLFALELNRDLNCELSWFFFLLLYLLLCLPLLCLFCLFV